MSRQSKNPGRMKSAIRSGLFLLTTLGLSGCYQYFERQDPVTYGVGDAIAQNKATHTIHPWPRGADNPRHATNGARALIAIERYEKNESIKPKVLRSQKNIKSSKQ